MGSNGTDNVFVSGNEEAKCSNPTVEIKIKTLDSQTYTLRVDRCVPVPALKEQIASVTGVLSEQQRLICRGKVLKDDQLLSAYHVEDGHTLHLVVRHPTASSSQNVPNETADPLAGSGHGQGSRISPGVMVGTFNISEQGDGAFPDINRIVSAVLGSFGIASLGSGSGGIDLNEAPSDRAFSAPGFGSLRNSSRQHSDQAATRVHFQTPGTASSSLPTAVPLDPLQPPVIPDSLTTISQYISHLREESRSIFVGQSNTSQSADNRGSDGQHVDAAPHSSEQSGIPTPASLAGVISSSLRLLNEDVAECLQQLERQLLGSSNVSDLSERMRIQTSAVRAGGLLQNLGALLLEVGRTVMTLRVGQTPAEAVVNAGPAVFVSAAGPNPIMVQPLPFQPGSGFGAVPAAAAQQNSGFSVGSIGSGFIPRNIDIRIRTAVNRRESTDSQTPELTVPASSGEENPAQQDAAAGVRSSTRESEVHVPTRTVIAAIPASVGRGSSDSGRNSMGIFYPVLARVQHVQSGNSDSARASQESEQLPAANAGRQPNPDAPLLQQNIRVTRVDGTTGQEDSGRIPTGLDQLLRTIFPGEHIFGDNVHSQDPGISPTMGNVGAAQNADSSQDTAAAVADEGTFLSNLLRQIIPIVSENMGTGSSNSSEAANVHQDGTPQAQDHPTSNRRTYVRRRRDPRGESPSSKRTRRE